MKKNLLLMATCVFSVAAPYDIKQLLSIAVAEKNSDLFTQLALGIPAEDRAKPAFKARIKAVGLDEESFRKKLEEQEKKLGYTRGASGGAQALSPAQYEQLKKELQLPDIPNITSKEQAKTELVNFFEKGTGDKLLTEIYGVQSPKKAIVDALKTAAPAA